MVDRFRCAAVQAKIEHVGERSEPLISVGEGLTGASAPADARQDQAAHDVDTGDVDSH